MIDVAIFAYNRPDYLRNCVESVRRNIPGARLRVYDDFSDDPAQKAYLASLGEDAVTRDFAGTDRHGGLYANMNAALAGAKGDLLLMLQDDMQVVRRLDDQDLQRMQALFDADPRRAFAGPIFMKEDRLRRFRRELEIDPAQRAYLSPSTRGTNPKRCLSYFDVHLAHVPRLRQAGWQYDAAGEGTNANRARALFGAMPMMGDPFAFFCPEVPFFRNREKKTLAARIAKRFVGEHLKSFEDMTPEDITALRNRDLAIWPIAETFLKPTDPRVVRPFVYKDVKARLWLYALHKIEQRVRG